MIAGQYFTAGHAVSAGIDRIEWHVAGIGKGGVGLEGWFGPVQAVAGHGKRHGSRPFAGSVDSAKKQGMRYRASVQQCR